MKYLVFLFIFYPFSLFAQLSCDDMLKSADKAEKQGNYRSAILKYNAVKKCNPGLENQIDAKILMVFDKIDKLKIEADRQARIAKEALLSADHKIREVLANDLSFRAEIEQDRTASFRLLEYANRINPNSPRVLQQLFNNYYLNQTYYYKTLIGQKSVNFAEFSPDDKLIATASGGGLVTLWDVQTGKPVKFLNGHNRSAKCARFSTDGNLLVTGASDETAIVWDIKSGAELHKHAFSRNVRFVDISPKNDLIAVALEDGDLYFVNVATHEKRRINAHTSDIRTVYFSNDGARVLTASFDRTAKIIDVITGDTILTLRGHRDALRSAVFSKDNKYILTASNDNTAIVWDAASGKSIEQFTLHAANVRSGHISPKGNICVTGSSDRSIQIWEFGEKKSGQIKNLIGHADDIEMVRFSNDGNMLASASEDNTVKIWFLQEGDNTDMLAKKEDSSPSIEITNGTINAFDSNRKKICTLYTGKKVILNASLSPDAKRIITASKDSTITVWNAITGKEENTFSCISNNISHCLLHADNNMILYVFNNRKLEVLQYPGLESLCSISIDYLPGKALIDDVFFDKKSPKFTILCNNTYHTYCVNADSILHTAIRNHRIAQLTSDKIEEYALEDSFSFAGITTESIIKENDIEKTLIYALYFTNRYKQTKNNSSRKYYRESSSELLHHLINNATSALDKAFYKSFLRY